MGSCQKSVSSEIGLIKCKIRFKKLAKCLKTVWKCELCAILSLYKANGYDLPVAVSFTFLSRPRNVKCRGASAELSSQDTKIWSESRCLAHNDRQHSGFYVGKEFDNKKLQEHYDFWHQAS